MTMSDVAQPSPNELSESRRRLLDRFLSGRSGKASDTITRALRGSDLAPLSFAQQQVWIHGEMTGDTPFYNETLTIYRRGPLDIEILHKCLVEMVRRHEIWRTTFEISSGQLAQRVHPVPNMFPLNVADLRAQSPEERATTAQCLAKRDAQAPFDLARGPVARALVVRLDEEEYRIYMTIHQIVFDAVTAYSVLLPELTVLYQAFASGEASPLSEPYLQYADFAAWQQQQQATESWSSHLSYWRKQLSGELPQLRWPHDHPRPSLDTHRGSIFRFALKADLVNSIKEFSRRQGLSEYMVLLAGLAALFHRYTGQNDLILGSFTAGRKSAELESMMGYFVNPLPLRIGFPENPTFHDLQSCVREVVLDGLAHDVVPLVEILKAIQYRPDSSRNPLFQVALSQQPKLPALPPGWDLATEEISNGGSKLDLMIVLDNREDGIFGPITYNPDIYDLSTVERMVAHWQSLLRHAIAEPEKPIAHLPLLDEVEKEEILISWNRTQAVYPDTATAHSLIETQAARRPLSTALVCGRQQLTYQELNDRANQLARYLRRLGVGPEMLVGVCMDRSLEMVIALLAVLKAGGAYVPLDPAYPQARLAFMIEDARLRFVITKAEFRSALAGSHTALVCVDDEQPLIFREIRGDLAVEMHSGNLAYVIYTSGSTGRPKGVQISHQALVNLLISMRTRPGLSADDRLLAVTTISFDIAALELYLPLIVGACCVLAPADAVADGRVLCELLEAHEITVMQATPSTWKLMLASGWNGRKGLKVLCGGEALSRELAAQLLDRVPEVWNLYGPTETTVWSAVHRVGSAADPVLIGQPIANTEMYILDDNLDPVPCGVSGELYIGGAGLARGYLNRPQLNAEKFISHPFRNGDRLYRTGDLARYQHGGKIECLGRIDSQVKIRGFRIELGEIESVLREHPAVSEACVIAREEVPGDKRLLAYLIVKDPRLLDEIRSFLKQRLPSHMLPQTVMLERFPLTPNGKLDKLALPAPSHPREEEGKEVREPQGPVEQLLVRLWSEMLQVPHVTPYDNFFDLGGHSLLATQMAARLETELGIRVRPKELAFQTLGQFAESCSARLQSR